MFEDLQSHSRIVVTGPQRSGTRIAARMIAADIGHRYVDEFNFGVHDHALWRRVLAMDSVVVQSPAMLKHVIDDPPPGVFVVLMRRSLEEIHASEDRIGWERDLRGNTRELVKYGLREGDSARIKYDYWDHHERAFAYREVEYTSLRGHPLWVTENLRRDFGPLQTAP